MINDRIKNSEKKEGFTLIELSLSIAFISVLSLAVALIITNSISAYHRGLVLNQINTTGMELVDDMRAAVQNAPVGSLKVLCETMLDGDAEAACKKEGGQRLVAARKMGKVQEINEDVPLLGVFCTGNYSYIWNSGYRFSEDFEVTSAENAATFKYRSLANEEISYSEDIRLLKVKDGKRAVCAAFSETSDSNVINIYDEKYGKVEEDPIEESTSKVSILDNEDNDNDVIQESSADYNKEEKIIPESLTDKLLQQKLSNSFQDTQFINVTGTKRKSNNEGLTKEFAEMYKKTFGVEVVSERQEKEEEKKTTDATSVVEIPDNIKISGFDSDRINYKYVGECFYTYAIIEIKDEMYIIDVKAAKERLTFEMVKENYYLNQMNSQELLLPDVISLSSKSAFNADKNKLLLSKAGFEFEEFGEDTVKLTAVPAICEPLNTKQLFSEILSNLEKVAINDTTEKELNIVSSIAKKIVEEEKLSFDEKDIDAILQQLLQLDNPFSYNYGQQAAIKMTRGDLERKFSRR